MVFFWVVLYGLTYTISEKISQAVDPARSITALAMGLYVILLVLWICRTGQRRNVGLCAVPVSSVRECLYFLPLLVLPLCNLLTAEGYRIDVPAAVLMVSVSVAEEIFFRGFMLRFLSKRSTWAGILLTSAVFALLHWVNLTEYGDAAYTLMQVMCAFVTGICYGAVTVRCGSLLPCAAAHVLTNITGVSAGYGWEMPGLWGCMAVYACYGIWLCRRIR